jgi:hypothetical protein
MDKNSPFVKEFHASMARQREQNDQAREDLEDTLAALRARTGVPHTAAEPILPPSVLTTAEPAARQFNTVTEAWVKTAVQAASVDPAFMQEVEEKAAKIVQAFLQQSASGSAAEPGAVSTGPNSG